MILRSLRWRLVLAMVLILGAALAAAGVFSSMTMKREFDRFLVAQRMDEAQGAAQMIRAARPEELHDVLARVHARYGTRTLVFDAQQRIVHRHPPELAAYAVELMPDGSLHLARTERGRLEAMQVKGTRVKVPAGTVYFLPPRERGPGASRTFRVAVDRWLLRGLAAAAVLAVLVMLTFFRRVFAPVEALTGGARALASGRLDARVDVRGNDEIAELARAFNGMAEALERNENARRNMVSDVAHELRTPLTNIRGQIEAAQDGLVAPDAKFLESIAEDTALLARLVDDLQQLSLADAGQLQLEREDADVAAIVDRALSGLDTRGLRVTREIPPGVALRVDVRRVVQVLRNLLVNAIAHASTAIDVRAIDAGDRIEIRVADDGPGVPPEHGERIFDRFYRADPSRSRTTGGAGLGLAIAKELVELHGGTIRYEKPAFIVTFIKS
jgi:signal transduction histidine kinase